MEERTRVLDETIASENARVDGYVSPDVAAALSGEQVEFGMELPTVE